MPPRPCPFAAGSGLSVFSTEEILARRWSASLDLLVTPTPLRTILALSLPGRLEGLGAIDLYRADPGGLVGAGVPEGALRPRRAVVDGAGTDRSEMTHAMRRATCGADCGVVTPTQGASA